MPQQRPFPTDPELTAISIGYRNRRMIADSVLPPVKVNSPQFKWYEHKSEERMVMPDTKVSRKGQVSEVEFSLDEKDGSVEEHGLEDAVPLSDIAEAPKGFNPLGYAVEGVTDIMLLGKEMRAKKILFDPTNYNYTKALVAAASGVEATKFSDPNADLLRFLLEQLDRPLMRPNTLTLGRKEWTQLRMNKSLVSTSLGNSGETGTLTTRQVADILEIDTINIGESIYNAANKGKGADIKKMWTGSAAFTYLDSNIKSIKNPKLTFGFNAVYKSRYTKRWHDENIGADGGQRVRVIEKCKPLVISKECGLLLTDVL